mmetsp:Transcript_49326/g.114014  ORF Transcript_49326/g.114014 Transcript_49326/m.114014 type:complete len:214 (-) Transcript_49326:200-841(-)
MYVWAGCVLSTPSEPVESQRRRHTSRRPQGSYRLDLLGALLDGVFHFRLGLLERLLEVLLGRAALVLAESLFLHLLDLVDCVSTHISECDLAVLTNGARSLCELLAPLRGQLRDVETYHRPIIAGRHTEVRLEQRTLNIANARLVVYVDDELRGSRCRDRRELVERRRGAVVLDLHTIEHAGGRAAHAQRRKLLHHIRNALLEFGGGVFHQQA